jgi:hypothetical protein
VKADADVQRHDLWAPVVSVDLFLHLDGARHRIHRRVEHHHEAVADVLDLASSAVGYGFPQEREVRSP